MGMTGRDQGARSRAVEPDPALEVEPHAALLLEASTAAVLLLEIAASGALVCMAANRVALELGVVGPDHAGKSLGEACTPELVPAIEHGYEAALAAGHPAMFEAIATIGGVERWWLVKTAVSLDPAGRPLHLAASLLDLELLRETELALRRTVAARRDMVRRVTEALGRIQGALAELRGALAPSGQDALERAARELEEITGRGGGRSG